MNDLVPTAQLHARILVIDDKPANLRLLTRMLDEQGHVSHAANSGAAALQFLATSVPDLILLDVKMPEMDGYEVCRRIKASERLRDVPVIFVSAMDAAWDKVKAFSAGAADYIVKPIEESELLVRVETHLSLRRLHLQLEQQVQARTAELQKAKEALYQKKQLLQAIIDSSTALIHVKDRDGCYLLVNKRFQELFGAELGDLRGLTDHEIFPAQIADAMCMLDREVIASGRAMEAEETFPLMDGTRTYVSAKSPLHDLDGAIYAVCGIATDITERAREETMLRTLNDMLESRLAQRAPPGDAAPSDDLPS